MKQNYNDSVNIDLVWNTLIVSLAHVYVLLTKECPGWETKLNLMVRLQF